MTFQVEEDFRPEFSWDFDGPNRWQEPIAFTLPSGVPKARGVHEAELATKHCVVGWEKSPCG